MFRTRSVKAYYDGALGSRGARMLEDYSDMPGHRGVSGEGYGFDQSWIRRMMEAGFQVGIHAIGDAGNRESLDFVESVYGGAPHAFTVFGSDRYRKRADEQSWAAFQEFLSTYLAGG